MINQEEISGCVACRPGGQAGLLVIGKYKQLPAKTRHKAEMLKVTPSYTAEFLPPCVAWPGPG